MKHKDLCLLQDVLHKDNLNALKQKLQCLYAAAGIDEDKLPLVLAELTRRPSFTEVWRWIYTPVGALHTAATLTGRSVAEVEDMDPFEVMEIVNGARERNEEVRHDIPLSESSGAGTGTLDLSEACCGGTSTFTTPTI